MHLGNCRQTRTPTPKPNQITKAESSTKKKKPHKVGGKTVNYAPKQIFLSFYLFLFSVFPLFVRFLLQFSTGKANFETKEISCPFLFLFLSFGNMKMDKFIIHNISN